MSQRDATVNTAEISNGDTTAGSRQARLTSVGANRLGARQQQSTERCAGDGREGPICRIGGWFYGPSRMPV
jgi:hypothetical protein